MNLSIKLYVYNIVIINFIAIMLSGYKRKLIIMPGYVLTTWL